MTPDARPPNRIPDPYVYRPGPRRATGSRYRHGARQPTRTLTAKLVVLSVIATLVIGGLLAVQMAAGSDPALGPKAAAQAKRAAAKNASNSSTANSNGAGSDPYSQSYGDDGYYYPYSSAGAGSFGSSGSSGSSSGSSGYSGSPPPVTSSTS